MTISARAQNPSAAITGGQRDQLTGIALMTGSAASNQLGAATAALAFPVLGPAGVVAIRQWVAGAVLFTTVRPRFTSFSGNSGARSRRCAGSRPGSSPYS
jgi:inner membrane transporter RhtA